MRRRICQRASVSSTFRSLIRAMLLDAACTFNLTRLRWFLRSIAEVLIAPSALHIDAAKSAVRPDVAVAIQDIHTAKVSGASVGT